MSRPDAEHDAVHEAAAQWFARLREPDVSLEETIAWQRWRSADPRHAVAFHRIEEAWQEAGSIPVPPRAPSRAEMASDAYDGSVPVSDWHPDLSQENRAGRITGRARALIVTASAAGLAVAVLCAPYLSVMLYETPAVRLGLQTLVGENRSVRLPDDTEIELGGDTAVKFRMFSNRRELALEKGEVFIRESVDSSRPFSVRVRRARVTALGTAFDVRQTGDRVTVAVLEGAVLVESRREPSSLSWLPIRMMSPQASRLSAGDRLVVEHDGEVRSSKMRDADEAIRWERGELAFEGETLRSVIADVNRYAKKPIVTEGHELEALTITGTVDLANITGWVRSLESAFDLEAQEQPAEIVLRRK